MKWLIKTNGCNHSSFKLETIQYKHKTSQRQEHKNMFLYASKCVPMPVSVDEYTFMQRNAF